MLLEFIELQFYISIFHLLHSEGYGVYGYLIIVSFGVSVCVLVLFCLRGALIMLSRLSLNSWVPAMLLLQSSKQLELQVRSSFVSLLVYLIASEV